MMTADAGVEVSRSESDAAAMAKRRFIEDSCKAWKEGPARWRGRGRRTLWRNAALVEAEARPDPHGRRVRGRSRRRALATLGLGGDVRQVVRHLAQLRRLNPRQCLVHRRRVADACAGLELGERLGEVVLALAGDARHLFLAGVVVA